MAQNTLIAVCDILGFKDLIHEVKLDDFIQHHLATFRRAAVGCVSAATPNARIK